MTYMNDFCSFRLLIQLRNILFILFVLNNNNGIKQNRGCVYHKFCLIWVGVDVFFLPAVNSLGPTRQTGGGGDKRHVPSRSPHGAPLSCDLQKTYGVYKSNFKTGNVEKATDIMTGCRCVFRSV